MNYKMLKFSLIIPTYNAGVNFRELVESIRSQIYKFYEVIILDSQSTDKTLQYAEILSPKILKIKKNEFDHGGTRNLGAKMATGDVLVFITQDILFCNNNILYSFFEAFSDQAVGGAYARQLPRIGATPVEELSRIFSYPEKSRLNTYNDFTENGVTALFFANPCACVRREIFEKVGGFPNHIICNEDMVMAYKIMSEGYKTMYVSDAIVRHSHNYSFFQLISRFFDIGCFFSNYPELNEKAKNSSEGLNQVKKSIQYLYIKKQIHWIPILLFETIAKFFGYNLGNRCCFLPKNIKKKISMNKAYWVK